MMQPLYFRHFRRIHAGTHASTRGSQLKGENQPTCPPVGHWTNCNLYTHTMKHYSAVNRKGLMLHKSNTIGYTLYDYFI